MSEFTLSIASLVIGVVVTIWVSRYYFKRTVNKSLTPYVQFSSALFEGVDRSVRDELKISYKGVAVDELVETQFLIANTGERSIRDVIHPLTLALPKGCALLDASVLHVFPEGREVSITRAEDELSFVFPLLNAGDYFIAKLLFQGRAVDEGAFRFKITVDDLPPSIEAVSVPPDLVEADEKRRPEWSMFWIGLLFFLFGSAVAALLYGVWPIIRDCWQTGLLASFSKNWSVILGGAIAAIPMLLLQVMGVMLMIGCFTNFSFPRRRRYIVPKDLLRNRIYLSRA